MDRMLRVGVIGASAGRGWARLSHIPAIQGLAELTLSAVVGSSQESADAAARTFGVDAGYGDASDLFRDPSVDLVAITVKVPDHRDLVLAAAAAGKHIFCEWPLGRNRAEAAEMAAAVRAAGVHAAIGLQARMNPAVRHACRLIVSGAIGRVLSARIVSATVAFGPKVEAAMAFAEDDANGVTLVKIQGGHTIDLAIALLGPLGEAGSLVSTRYPQVEVGDDATASVRSAPDHLLLQGRTRRGAALSIEVAGGHPSDAVPFGCEITGEEGSLVLEGGAARGFQSGRLCSMANRSWSRRANCPDCPMPRSMSPASTRGCATMCATEPTLFPASTIHLTKVVEDMLVSSVSGTRLPARDWPA